MQIEGLVTEMEAATGGYVSGLQQRILHAILARPELRCMSDYIMKVCNITYCLPNLYSSISWSRIKGCLNLIGW